MAKKVLLKDSNNIEVLPITRGELVLDSSGNPAFHSNEFLATNSQPGLMSPDDKQKLETVAGNTIDTELSNTSTNPVQNKVLTQIINSIRDKYLKSAVISGNKVTITDQSNNTIEFVNSTYQIVTNAVDGLVPKYDAVDGTIDTQTTDWILTNHNGTLGWYKLPAAAFSSSSAQLFVGAKSTSNNNNSNSATTNGNTYLKLFDNSTLKNQYNIKGTGLTTVISDANGTITINVPTSHNQASSDINSLTGYTKAKAITAITTSDSLNTALGKLELKADTTYELVKGAYDGDGTIENLEEILRVLDGIKDTDTILAIIGKYLPLSGGMLTSESVPLQINRKSGNFSSIAYYRNDIQLGILGFTELGVLQVSPSRLTANTQYYTILHENNYFNYTPKLDGTGATGIWNIDISGDANTLGGYDESTFLKRYTYTIPIEKCVRIKFNQNVLPYNAIIYGRCTIQNGSLILVGNGYGENRIRNNWTQLNKGTIKWSVPNSDSYYRTIEIQGKSTHPIYLEIISSQTPTFTEIDSLSSESLNDPVALLSDIPTALKNPNAFTVFGVSYDGSAAKTVNMSTLIGVLGTGDGAIIDTTQFLTSHVSGFTSTGNTTTIYKRTASHLWSYIKSKTDDLYVTALGTSGNYVTWTKNGTINNLTVPYAANSGNIYISNSSNNGVYPVVFTNTGSCGTPRYDALYVDNISGAGYNPSTNTFHSSGFVKSGSTDSYLLLGGGGHKALSDFLLETEFASKELSSNLITITKSLKLTKNWLDTGITLNKDTFTYGSGTYVVQVYIDAGSTENFWYSYFSGIMSVYANYTNADVPDDEIVLHHSSHACGHYIYLKTKPTSGGAGSYAKLYIACNKDFTAARDIRFKFKKLI